MMEQLYTMQILNKREKKNMEEVIKQTIQEVNMLDKAERDIALIYKQALEQVTEQKVEVTVGVISDGKYGVQVTVDGRIFWMISNELKLI